jgi:biopolymer transport protein ExbD
VVAITRDGKVFLSPGAKLVPNPEELGETVRTLLEKNPIKLVYVRADQRAKYKIVEDVVDDLRAGGVDQLGLLTEQIQDKNKPAAAGGSGGL